jgi:CheY-like chemotaxis protein
MSDDTETAPDIVLLCTDLMFDSRIGGAAQAAGLTVRSTGSADDAVSLASRCGCRLLILDLTVAGLSTGDVMTRLQAECAADTRPRVIAFGPHVQSGKLEAAREAGCDQVLTRGQFDAWLNELLQASG